MPYVFTEVIIGTSTLALFAIILLLLAEILQCLQRPVIRSVHYTLPFPHLCNAKQSSLDGGQWNGSVSPAIAFLKDSVDVVHCFGLRLSSIMVPLSSIIERYQFIVRPDIHLRGILDEPGQFRIVHYSFFPTADMTIIAEYLEKAKRQIFPSSTIVAIWNFIIRKTFIDSHE